MADREYGAATVRYEDSLPGGFQSYFDPVPEPVEREVLDFGFVKIDPTGGLMGASLRELSPVFHLMDIASEPTFKPNPDFDLPAAIKKRGLWDNDRHYFLGVQSQEEMDWRVSVLEKETMDTSLLDDAGWAGFASRIAAGSFDPTLLLPLTAGGRGLRAVAQGAAIASGTAAGEEIIAQRAKVNRPLGESAFNIGTSLVLGGILGGAAGYLNRPIQELADDTDMEILTGKMRPGPVSGGAAVARGQSSGGIKKFLPGRMQSWAAQISPVVRVIDQDVSAEARWTMEQIDTGGLRREGNAVGIPTTPDATVVNREKQWHVPLADWLVKFDDLYGEYFVGTKNPGWLKTKLAGLAGATETGIQQFGAGKISKEQFAREVTDAMNSNDEHPIPQVAELAKLGRATVLQPMHDEAKVRITGVKDLDDSMKGDKSHVMRVWDTVAVRANPQELVRRLANHDERKLQEWFAPQIAHHQVRVAREKMRIEDMTRPEAEAEALREMFDKALKTLQADNKFAAEEEEIQELIQIGQLARKVRQRSKAAEAYKEGRKIRSKLMQNPEYVAMKGNREELRRRLANLTQNRHVVDKRLKGKLGKARKLEEDAEDSLLRLTKAGQKALNELDGDLSDKALDALAEKLSRQFDSVSARLDKNEAKLREALQWEPHAADMPEFAAQGIKSTDQIVEESFFAVAKGEARLDEIAERIREIGGSLVSEIPNPTAQIALRKVVQDGLDRALYRTNKLNLKRGERIARLRDDATNLDPKIRAAEIERIKAKIPAMEEVLRERVTRRAPGVQDLNIEGGNASFRPYALEVANEVVQGLKKSSNIRIQGLNILEEARGPELSRVLDIPSMDVKEFTERDARTILKTFVRTLAPDIELARKFDGSPNAVQQFNKMTEEEQKLSQEIDADKKLTPEQKARKQLALTNVYKNLRTDLTATIARARRSYGLPDDPDAISYRIGSTVMHWNVLRLMGMVVISSVSDPWRAVQKYGLAHTFRTALIPMVTDFSNFRAYAAREAKLAGTALDVTLHSRSSAMFDVVDFFGRHSKFERAVEYASGRQGLVAAFDFWTSGIKQFVGVAANAYLTRALQDVVEGAGQRQMKKSIAFLASVGIDGSMAERMWKEITSVKGGAKAHNGVWFPNTEYWLDAEARTVYRAALAGQIDDAIITPGLERPLWMSATLVGRMVGQFRSFSMSSAVKTQMAGLQQRDMAFVNGSLGMMAFGVGSYYLRAYLTGGDAWTEAQNTVKEGRWGKIADEAFDASGLAGPLSEIQNMADILPFVKNTNLPGTDIPTHYLLGRFSDEPIRRNAGRSPLEIAFGPTVGLANNMGRFAQGIDAPTQSTAHQFRVMVPWQNVFWLRGLYDKAEQATGLPERRN